VVLRRTLFTGFFVSDLNVALVFGVALAVGEAYAGEDEQAA
jgi:hypothetical protein